jgi:PAS domain-containing protein
VREGRLHAPVAGGGPDEADALWRTEFRRALHARAPVRFDYEQRTPDGARWLSVIVVFVGNSPAGPLRYSFVAEEVTERKRVEQAVREGEARRAFLVALDTALRPLTDGDLQREACRITREELGADRVAHCEAGGDGALLVTAVDVARGVGPGPGQVRIGEFGVHAAADLRAGHTVGCDDSAADMRGAARPFDDVRACLHAPIVRNGTVLALLTAHCRGPHAWTAAEAALLEDAAERTWVASTRSRAEAALRDSEARLADLIEAMPVGVGLFDCDGRVVVANAEMRRWLPWSLVPSLDERAGPSRGRHPDGRRIEPADHPAARALRGERVVPGVEIVHALDDGSEVRTRVAATPTRDDDGRITGVIAIVTEIGARERAAREEGERSASLSAD